MIKLFDMVLKDFKVFSKEGTSVLLILLGPLIIMTLIGFIFSGSSTDIIRSENIGDIPILICDLDGGLVSGNFTEGLEQFEFIKSTKTNEPGCDLEIRSKILVERYRMGIVFPSNYSDDILNGKPRNITVYLDNSDFLVRSIVYSTVSISVEALSDEFSVVYIEKVWDSLKKLKNDISKLSDSVIDSKSDLIRMQTSLHDSRSEFENLNITSFREDLIFLIDKTEKLENATDEKMVGLEDALSGVDEQIDAVSSISEDTEELKYEILLLRNEIGNTTDSLQSFNPILIIIQGYIGEPIKSQLGQVVQDLNLTISKNQQISSQITDIYDSLDYLGGGLDDIENHLLPIKDDIQKAREGIEESKLEIAEVKSKLNNMLNEIEKLEEMRTKNIQIMLDTENKISEMINDIDKLDANLKESQQKLDDFVSMDPETVVTPTSLNSMDLFEERKTIDFFFSGILSSVIMFSGILLSSISIIREKTSGNLNRMLLAPIPRVLPIISITFVNFVFMLIQSIISMFTVMVVFNVVSVGSLIDIVILGGILSLPFICFGILLGLTAKEENTVILVALTVGMPSLFLSNTIYPFEMMPDYMVAIGKVNPIYYGATAIKNVVLLGKNLISVSEFIIPLLLQALILGSLTFIAVYRYRGKL